MSWAKFDDQYPDHPKIVEVGPLGMALHMAATCYCARYLTDGFVPATMIARLISFDGIEVVSNGVSNAVTNKEVTDELVRVGLLEVVQGGYKVHDYLEYNPPAAQVKAEKAKNAKRQNEWRENHRNDKGEFVSNAVTNGTVTPAPSPSPSLNSSGDTQELNQVVVVPRPQNIFSVYEREVGALTPMLSDALQDIEKSYPDDWFVEAVREAKKSSARISLKYIEAILKRWKSEGKSNGQQPKKQSIGHFEGEGSERMWVQE